MDFSSPQYTETLHIENFLNIKEFHWDIKPFNIITGDMRSGKSLCIKLLYFFEKIFVSSIILAPSFSKKLFENGHFYDRLSKKFNEYFYLKDNNNHGLYIAYSCKIDGADFAISLTWNDSKNELLWKCNYLDKNLGKWSGYFTSPETIEMSRKVRNQIHEDILHDFKDKLPISSIFVPASRAALAVVGSNTAFIDPFLSEFVQQKDFLLSYPDISLSDKLAEILKVENIAHGSSDDSEVFLKHSDGRSVPSLFSSSGQQELVYLLLLLEKLPRIQFTYGRMLSVFIEEPSAHLFPEEQKEIIESIAGIFRKGKEIDTRFFITTHSPYVLNVINNMLKKGGIIKRNKDRVGEIEGKIDFPPLFAEEMSASFINKDGIRTDMLEPDEDFIFADKIADISYQINEGTIELDKLNNKLIYGQETE